MLLAGDIGGTKTDLAIFSKEAGPHSPLVQAKVHSGDYPSLHGMVIEFLTKVKMPVERACFDVAGPVVDGRVQTTNLPWVTDEGSLAKELNLKSVHLMNDLEAVALAIPVLRASDVCTSWNPLSGRDASRSWSNGSRFKSSSRALRWSESQRMG